MKLLLPSTSTVVEVVPSGETWAKTGKLNLLHKPKKAPVILGNNSILRVNLFIFSDKKAGLISDSFLL